MSLKISNIYKGSATVNSTNLTMKINIYDDYGNVSALKNNGLSESFFTTNYPCFDYKNKL